MRRARRTLVTVGTLILAGAGIAACGAVSRPVNDDGNDITNPSGTNPGTPRLVLTSAKTVLTVGDGAAITATYGGLPLNGGGYFLPVTLSDSSVISGNWSAVYALSVGNASVTVSYGASQATIGFGVQPDADGVSAIVLIEYYGTGGPAPMWLPASAKFRTGWTVRFRTTDNIAGQHNVVFDAVPGAPANIPVGTEIGQTALRVFSTPGSFPYHCTIHGEGGVVTVTP